MVGVLNSNHVFRGDRNMFLLGAANQSESVQRHQPFFSDCYDACRRLFASLNLEIPPDICQR